MKMKNWDLLLLGGLILLLVLYTARINWRDGQWQHVIESDGKGYYAYLPAVFVYQDLHFGFYDSVEVARAYDTTLAFDYRSTVYGVQINKFYAGTAFCLIPFFIPAHLLSLIMDLPADGYAQLYVIFLTLGALFYLGLGLYAFRMLMLAFGLTALQRSVVTLSMVLGTNLFYYAIGEVSMSHVYSFAWVSVFLYSSYCFLQGNTKTFSWWIPISLGMIVFIRPVNGLILLSWPFLAGDFSILKARVGLLFKHPLQLIIGVTLLLIPPFIQLILYKLQTGHFLIYSYGQDYFDFLNPHIADFLWSYRKGYFIYTPIALIACIGFWVLRHQVFRCLSLLGFYALLIYVLSSWWNWYYGGSFSSRVMVEYLPLTGLLLGIALKGLSESRFRWGLYVLLMMGVALNQFQTLQYRYYMIHWSNMDAAQYWDVFLRWDKEKIKTQG